ncbi:probable peptidylglycine alpha-hydroxylating monooxygenase 1 isoform X1 [Haliotis rufescens]|uniref:probable peptidylglycine alpha-hydroxylating monooxygenase 1 isoform X1 n=1 Tax=Haliotis rufescens TaxID=6454 RepID=UPI001EAFE89A|nr:probable peptidylglycine alpha-hydroxylating monooxygenase 1 isoform X1 [Haliotis rufescens]
MALVVISLVLGLCVGAFSAPAPDTPKQIDLLMPHVQPKVPDTYLCHGMKLNSSATYITGFIPNANMNIAHHMLLYGCTSPGMKKPVWNCGEMASDSSMFDTAPTCASGAKILYAWAMDAPSLSLPKDVAFAVGGDTDIKYLVLQVHYKNVTTFLPPQNGNDTSGLNLITQKTKLPRRAGVYLMGTGGRIKPKSTVFMETACKFESNLEIHPFAFRTHTHTLGRVVSGYRIRDGKWTEIGRMNPQKPQMFYNVTTPNLTVKPGDILAARCTMLNDRDTTVKIGATQNDEMCNFYIMYYVDGKTIMDDNYCFTSGPPNWSWEKFGQGDLALEDMPNTVSWPPGSSEPLEEGKDDVARDDESLESILDNLQPRELEELYEELAEEGKDKDQNGYYYGGY